MSAAERDPAQGTVVLLYGLDPSAPGQGKFLQLVWRHREHLLFAPRAVHQYHNQMLAVFAAEQGIPHRWEDAAHLQLDAPDLAVLGGGRFMVDPGARSLVLYDDSQAYGRFREEGLAARLGAAGHPWSGFQVVVR